MRVQNPPTYDRVVGLAGTVLKPKLIEIVDWNMDTTDQKTVAHGLAFADIIGIDAEVSNDLGTLSTCLCGDADLSGASDGKLSFDATDVICDRKVGGFYDSVDYDALGHRGWIRIWTKE